MKTFCRLNSQLFKLGPWFTDKAFKEEYSVDSYHVYSIMSTMHLLVYNYFKHETTKDEFHKYAYNYIKLHFTISFNLKKEIGWLSSIISLCLLLKRCLYSFAAPTILSVLWVSCDFAVPSTLFGKFHPYRPPPYRPQPYSPPPYRPPPQRPIPEGLNPLYAYL